MGKTVAILHTTPVTVEPLKALAAEVLPGYEVVNFVDDSILPQLARNGGDLAAVEPRLAQYARFAEDVGAAGILNACSSVGPLVRRVQEGIAVPIVRIDDAMAEEAVRRGSRVGVVATLSTTLGPTVRLVEAKAEEVGKRVEVVPVLAESAYRQLLQGDKEGHDRLLAGVLRDLARRVDVVVLAQASMARVVATLAEDERDRFLSSPRLGMERLKVALEGAQS